MTPIRIGTVSDKVQAQMVVDMLSQHGISAYSESISVTSYRDSYRGYGVGGQAIFTDTNDAAEAKELAGEFFIENNVPPQTKGRKLIARIWAIFMLLLFVAYLVYSMIDNFI